MTRTHRRPDNGSRTLASRARGADRLIGLVILAAAALLVLGWVLPMMTIERMLFLREQVSILEGCAQLWSEGHFFLFAVIVLFSVVFPLTKIGVALHLWYRADATAPGMHRLLDRLESVGRWSMLDVFAAALVVVAVQVSIVSDVEVHAGIYVFTAAVLLSMLAVRRLILLARLAAEDGPRKYRHQS